MLGSHKQLTTKSLVYYLKNNDLEVSSSQSEYDSMEVQEIDSQVEMLGDDLVTDLITNITELRQYINMTDNHVLTLND